MLIPLFEIGPYPGTFRRIILWRLGERRTSSPRVSFGDVMRRLSSSQSSLDEVLRKSTVNGLLPLSLSLLVLGSFPHFLQYLAPFPDCSLLSLFSCFFFFEKSPRYLLGRQPTGESHSQCRGDACLCIHFAHGLSLHLHSTFTPLSIGAWPWRLPQPCLA